VMIPNKAMAREIEIRNFIRRPRHKMNGRLRTGLWSTA